MRTLAHLCAIAALALGLPSAALAHVNLLKSSPAANATLQEAPKAITLRFDRRLLAASSSIELTMPAHGMKVPVRTTVSPDGNALVGSLQKPLGKGAYKVVWTVAGADGHKMTGELVFRIG
jgi:methionine-rich copper-binding protein CopC